MFVHYLYDGQLLYKYTKAYSRTEIKTATNYELQKASLRWCMNIISFIFCKDHLSTLEHLKMLKSRKMILSKDKFDAVRRNPYSITHLSYNVCYTCVYALYVGNFQKEQM